MPESALSASGLPRARALVARLPRSLMLFVVVGLIGLGVHTALFSVLFRSRCLVYGEAWVTALATQRTGIHLSAEGDGYGEAWLTALATATFVTWSLNRRLTFAGTGRHGGWEIVRYALVTILAQSVSFGVSKAMLGLVAHLPPEIALIAGAVVATAFSYTGQRFFTFRVYGSGHVEVVAVGDTPLLVAAPAVEPTV